MTKPIELEEIIEEEVIDISHEGKAVLRYNDFIIFSDVGIIGDKLKVKIKKIKKSFAIAETIEILEKSTKRDKSECKYSDLCGGCQLWDMKYEEELKFKKDMLVNDLHKLGGLEHVEVYDTLGMDEPYRYRNNVQIPVFKSKGKALIGHYEKASHRIVDTKKCLIQEEVADRIIDVFRRYIEEYNIPTYNRNKNLGLIRHIIIRTSYKTKDTMVIVVINGKRLIMEDKLIDMLNEIDEFKSLYININTKRTSQVTGKTFKHIYGEKFLIDHIGEYSYKISPESFFQVNTLQAKKLYDVAKEYANLTGEEIVVDLYAGIGTIGMYMANDAKHVYSIEINEQAVKDARENAELNKVENISFFQGGAEKMLPEINRIGIKPDILVVDPPRRGFEEGLLEEIIDISPEKIVYISCNPSTLSRDLSRLEENGYEAIKCQPVDMFPKTVHVETVAILVKE